MPTNITAIEAAVLSMQRHKKVASPPRTHTKKPEKVDSKNLEEPRRTRQSGFVSRSKLFRDIKLLEKELRSLSETGQEAAYDNVVSKIELAKSKRSLHATKPNRKIKEPKTKRNRKGAAVMYASTRHHSRKVYISPEQRRLNKIQDGVGGLLQESNVVKLVDFRAPQKNPSPARGRGKGGLYRVQTQVVNEVVLSKVA